MRHGASAGLRPAEIADMTEREVELFVEGSLDAFDRVVWLLGWVQANLINVQIPRGKGKLTVAELVNPVLKPRPWPGPADTHEADLTRERATIGDDNASPVDRVRAVRDAVRRQEAARDRKAFWTSAKGRKLMRALGDGSDPEAK